ncbi:unnamed protein product [Victoria cruziana]
MYISKHNQVSEDDDVPLETLETYIVGRRFYDEADLKQGASIIFIRDPENVKDQFAIKGFISSLPKNSSDDVPIRVICQKVSQRASEFYSHQYFQSLWSNAIRAAESTRSLPGMKRYQMNFHILMQEVMNHHGYLFTDEEKSFLGPWFRVSNVSYPEVLNAEIAVEELCENGYMYRWDPLKLTSVGMCREVLSVLTVQELQEFTRFVHVKKNRNGSRREQICDSLVTSYADGTCLQLPRLISEKIGKCISISSLVDSLLWRIQRLFFLDGEHDLSAFLLVDLGLVRYPRYVINISENIFTSRDDLLAYEELLKQLLNIIPCGGKRGYWALRWSVDLEHLSHLDESLAVAEESLADPWVRSGLRIALQKRVLRLGKPPRRWKVPNFARLLKRKINEVHVRGVPLTNTTGMKSRFYGYRGEQCGVEELALQYYAEVDGWQGLHSENGIWMTLFALLMWDVIFADIPDVFRTRFQTAPLDLECDSFYRAREGLIESQLQNIENGMAGSILTASWNAHVGISCKGVRWDQLPLSDLQLVVSCIKGPTLAALCRLLAQDYRSWSSGMPDLLLWRLCDNNDCSDSCNSGSISNSAKVKLVEVKGPNDRLSEQQHAWLLALMDCGLEVEVCKIRPVAIDK